MRVYRPSVRFMEIYEKRQIITNSNFSSAFEKIAVAVDEILSRAQEAMYCDSGNIDFIVTYDDGNKIAREFGVPADEFADCFKKIVMMSKASRKIQML